MFRKRHALLLSILVFLFVGTIMAVFFERGVLFDMWKLFHSDRFTIANYVSPEQISQLKKEQCRQADVINYLYYEKVPLDQQKNNKFGLYIYAENSDYFEIAQNLVNSNGGEWGYVLIPFNVKDRDFEKWGRVFEQLNNKRLIPIIQLHDVALGRYQTQTQDAAEFLNSFVWPIRQRYITVYNEPNDSKFWYGRSDPEEYARVLDFTIREFKTLNPDFFVLNGALNISADSGRGYIDALEFMRRMNIEVPGIFDKLDGWASHSYPQPNFSGGVHDTGRQSVRAYEVELDFLKNNLGVKKDLPVFITETGWAHAEGVSFDNSFLPGDIVAGNYRKAYQDVWLKDDRVKAVTPFTIWYSTPYDHFSWVSQDNQPYQQYLEILEMKKTGGNPEKINKGVVKTLSCE